MIKRYKPSEQKPDEPEPVLVKTIGGLISDAYQVAFWDGEDWVNFNRTIVITEEIEWWQYI